MNTTIWILQGVLATVFFFSGTLVYLLRQSLQSKLSWLSEYSASMVLFICLSKIAGAAGLILPLYFNVLPWLTPVAALGLATIMVLAARYHWRKREYKDVPATLLFLVLLLLVAFFRIN